jgi:formate dehydrogenase major subunit
VADYPTYEDRNSGAFQPCVPPIQENDFSEEYPIILTSGRLVEYEGGGDGDAQPWLAECNSMFVE